MEEPIPTMPDPGKPSERGEPNPPVDPPSSRVGETASGRPLYEPTHMPSDARLAGIAKGLHKLGLVSTPQAAITEAAVLERSWQRLAQATEVPLPDAVVRFVMKRRHRVEEQYRSRHLRRPAKSPERYAVDQVYQELTEGTLKYREGVISR